MYLGFLALLAQRDNGAGAIGMVGVLVYLALIIAIVAGTWKVFEKAGKPGWASIIPIYNVVVILEIIGKPIWWLILLFVPCVNIAIAIMIPIELARVFRQGVGFGIGMILLPFIFYPMLGFGSANMLGPTPSGITGFGRL